MFLEKLKVYKSDRLLREVSFLRGLNFILDSTSQRDLTKSGNGVGKTTVLKCVDYCFGHDDKAIFASKDSGNKINEEVKSFLYKGDVYLELTTVDDIDQPKERHVIRRNFGEGRIFSLDGKQYPIKSIDGALKECYFPMIQDEKPTFRQLISKNIRYESLSLENVVKYLNPFTKDVEYETIFLFLMGLPQKNAEASQIVSQQIKDTETFLARLEKERSYSECERYLSVLNSMIVEKEKERQSMNLDPDFEKNMDDLSSIKERKSVLSASLAHKSVEIELSKRQLKEMEEKQTDIDLNQLKTIYADAKSLIPELQVKFEELVGLHQMSVSKQRKWYEQTLATKEREMVELRKTIFELDDEERRLSERLSQTSSYASLNRLIEETNDLYETRGTIQERLNQIKEVRARMKALKEEKQAAEGDLYSEEFKVALSERVDLFNKNHFSKLSRLLYGENYLLNVSLDEKAKGGAGKIYRFSTFNPTFSSGKQQGEILAFDLAYIEFADAYDIPHANFLMYDKKELMSDNQLTRLSEYLKGKGVQVIVSMLRDKVPSTMLENGNIACELSEDNRFFRLESVR